MKKSGIIIMICCALVTGCNTQSNSESATTETVEKISETQTETTESIEFATEPDSILSENIQEIDLEQPENSGYLQYVKESAYSNEYELPDGRKIVEDGSIYLEESSGERTVLIEMPPESYIQFYMIDNSRFYYYIIKGFDVSGGTGVYNIETGYDFRIDAGDDYTSYYPDKVIDNYLYFSLGKHTVFSGFGKLNLDTFEVETLVYPEFDNSNYTWLKTDVCPDGTKAAVYSKSTGRTNDMIEYRVDICSLTEEKVLHTYSFFSRNDYILKQLTYSDNNVYLSVKTFESNPENYLYIVDIE